MILNKKRVFLYSSILLLILAGVYFVNSLGFINRTPLLSTGFVTTNTTPFVAINDTISKGAYNLSFTELANWTRGGGIELFNFTLQVSSIVINISEINITMPSGGFTNITIYAVGGRNTSNQLSDNGGNWTLARVYNDVADSTYIATFRALGNGTLANGSYPPGGVATNNGNLTGGQNISLWFNVIAANGTEAVYNWTVTVRNASTNTDTGLGVLTGVDGLPPRANGTNVTDEVNTKSSFASTQYFRYDTGSPQRGINISITVNDYNIDRVLLVYNNTGGSINLAFLRNELYNITFLSNFTGGGVIPFSNFSVLSSGDGGGQIGNATGLLSLTGRSDVRNGPNNGAPGYVFSFNISNNTWGNGATDGTTFKYVFVVYDLYNHSEIINNSNAEYVIARDANNPTATLTAPSDITIGVFDPIKYTCDGSDTSGLASCTTKLTKPGDGTVTKTGCGTEHTFTSNDNNEAGTSTVECTVKDNVGRSASKSSTFSVSAGSGGGGTGGAGGGGGATGSSADNPVTVSQGVSVDAGTLSTTETFTSVAKEGTVTFTVAGSSHSAKVLEVTTDSVTIEIASTPSQLTLTIGESGEVDVNDDGTNDLSVTLRAITNGMADLVFKSLEVAAAPSEPGEPGVVTGEEAQPGRAWLWIVLVVVVVGLVLWYLGRKKQ